MGTEVAAMSKKKLTTVKGIKWVSRKGIDHVRGHNRKHPLQMARICGGATFVLTPVFGALTHVVRPWHTLAHSYGSFAVAAVLMILAVIAVALAQWLPRVAGHVAVCLLLAIILPPLVLLSPVAWIIGGVLTIVVLEMVVRHVHGLAKKNK
jgi:hypothetical protein